MTQVERIVSKKVYICKNCDAIRVMTKISATILTYNEERRIDSCLESLKDIADEIIVVDSNSTDATLEICRRHGCRISQRPLAGYGAQRQYATSLTNYSYVLAIDADEVLSPALRKSLLKLKKEGFKHRVYSMARLNFYCGLPVKNSGGYPDIQIRLFDKRYANWNLRDVAEQVIFRDSVVPELLDGDLLHYQCETPDEFIATAMHQAEIKAKVIVAANDTINPLSPTLHAMKSFFNCYVSEKGMLDGHAGLAIARTRYRATKHAWNAARHIIKIKNNKQLR